jgi:membrane protease YdiL (CAAX protease family)
MSEAKAERVRPVFRVGGVTFDLHLSILVLLGLLLPMLIHYQRVPSSLMDSLALKPAVERALDQLILFFVVPMLFIVGVFREWPSRYGMGLGNWKQGLLWVGIVCPFLAVMLWVVMGQSDMQTWYLMRQDDSFMEVVLWSGVEMFGWEFYCRGLWLFGLALVIGPGPAIFLHAVPFALLHVGKVEIEALSTILSGPAMGFVAWKCQSFLYVWCIHWFMLAFTIWLAMNAAG